MLAKFVSMTRDPNGRLIFAASDDQEPGLAPANSTNGQMVIDRCFEEAFELQRTWRDDGYLYLSVETDGYCKPTIRVEQIEAIPLNSWRALRAISDGLMLGWIYEH
jgi:hypothetical protein